MAFVFNKAAYIICVRNLILYTPLISKTERRVFKCQKTLKFHQIYHISLNFGCKRKKKKLLKIYLNIKSRKGGWCIKNKISHFNIYTVPFKTHVIYKNYIWFVFYNFTCVCNISFWEIIAITSILNHLACMFMWHSSHNHVL